MRLSWAAVAAGRLVPAAFASVIEAREGAVTFTSTSFVDASGTAAIFIASDTGPPGAADHTFTFTFTPGTAITEVRLANDKTIVAAKVLAASTQGAFGTRANLNVTVSEQDATGTIHVQWGEIGQADSQALHFEVDYTAASGTTETATSRPFAFFYGITDPSQQTTWSAYSLLTATAAASEVSTHATMTATTTAMTATATTATGIVGMTTKATDATSFSSSTSTSSGMAVMADNKSSGGNGLGGGAIAGIVVGVVVVVAAATALAFFLRRRRASRHGSPSEHIGLQDGFVPPGLAEKGSIGDGLHHGDAAGGAQSPYSDDDALGRGVGVVDAPARVAIVPVSAPGPVSVPVYASPVVASPSSTHPGTGISGPTAALIEEGMSAEEIARLQAEEDELDAAIQSRQARQGTQ